MSNLSDSSYDHIVVGGGAMGASTAWQLTKRGRSVLLIEQFTQDHVSGSSHGGTRIFRLGHEQQTYTTLGIAALDLWRELEAESNETLVELIGHVDHGPAAVVAEIESNLKNQGLACERMSPEQANERWPGITFDANVVYSPDGGRAHAQRTVNTLWRRIVELGGEIWNNTRVASVQIDGEYAVVETAEQTLRTKSVVVAAGAWLPRLVGHHVSLRPLHAVRAQPSHFAPRPGFDDIDMWPTFIHRGLSAQPEVENSWYGLWTPGEGVKVGSHLVHDELDLDNRSFEINRKFESALQEYVAQWYPGLNADKVTSTTCIYTNEPNEHFILDRKGPLTVCSPCSGHGFKYVPAIGKITADLAMGGTQSVKEWQF
jgi:sarcosine oxidase